MFANLLIIANVGKTRNSQLIHTDTKTRPTVQVAIKQDVHALLCRVLLPTTGMVAMHNTQMNCLNVTLNDEHYNIKFSTISFKHHSALQLHVHVHYTLTGVIYEDVAWIKISVTSM